MTQLPPTQAPYKQLRRPTTDRMIAGVAGGVGRYFDVDPTLVRVIFAVAGLLTAGVALLAYPIMWFLMPEEPADAPGLAAPDGQRAGLAGPVGPPAGRAAVGPAGRLSRRGYSHSMVPGGLLVTSSTTRLTSGTSLVIRVEIRASRS